MALIHGQDASSNLVPLLVDASGRALVTLDTALPASSNLIGRVDGRLGNGLLGYSGPLNISAVNLNAAAGNNTLTTSVVPAGEIWHTEGISILNNTSTTTQELIVIDTSGANFQLAKNAGLAGTIPFTFVGVFTLTPGDSVSGVFSGCTLNDDLFIKVWGWKQSI